MLTPGDDLVQLAEQAVARGADVIGMAGGDGSQALVANDALDLHFVDSRGEAHHGADVVLVSNNPYVLDSLGGVGIRERMDTGTLGVVSLTVTSALDARRFLALEAAGQVTRFPGWQQWSTPRFELTSGGPVQVGVDGEALTLEPPVVFEILPAALTVLLPAHAPGRSPAARRVSRNTAGEIWHIALGRV